MKFSHALRRQDMRVIKHGFSLIAVVIIMTVLIGMGCQSTPMNTTTSNTNSVNTNVNTNTNIAGSTTTITTAEPESYQAAVKLTFEFLGEGQKTTPPPLGAVVARSGP